MNREQGTGNREEVLGNFSFRYLCRFFPFTYFTRIINLDFQPVFN
ncbi:hypothetical protein [Dolichospermum circinale]|nr:hypothetical protein [Dolichospermum circinale]